MLCGACSRACPMLLRRALRSMSPWLFRGMNPPVGSSILWIWSAETRAAVGGVAAACGTSMCNCSSSAALVLAAAFLRSSSGRIVGHMIASCAQYRKRCGGVLTGVCPPEHMAHRTLSTLSAPAIAAKCCRRLAFLSIIWLPLGAPPRRACTAAAAPASTLLVT